jgi:predicted membrane chloride channel (bestrophin family)
MAFRSQQIGRAEWPLLALALLLLLPVPASAMIVYDERGYSLLLHMAGSVLTPTAPHAITAVLSNLGLKLVFSWAEFDYVANFPSSAVYTPFSLGLAFLLVFRSGQAYNRYIEAVAHCFSIRSHLSNALMGLAAYTKPDEHSREFHRRHRRLTYAFQRAVVQELRGEHNCEKLSRLSALLPEETALLEACPNPPLAIMHWMLTSVSERDERKGFRCAPPVLARIFTNYNDCMNAYTAAKKIAR